MTLPKTYKAIELPAYNPNTIRALLSLKLIEKQLKNPGPQELLIKMEAAPCNPSDIAFMQGGYNVQKTLPTVMGFEGAGTVVACGDALEPEKWMGRRVSCFTQKDKDGTWAEYFMAGLHEVIPVAAEMTADQAATFFINPFTAFGLFEIALQRESQAIIVNAAGSRVAEFLFALAKQKNIDVIAIVRKAQTADLLQQKGINEILVSSETDFVAKLKESAHRLKATTAFDAVGGEMTGTLFNQMPPDSEVVVYGGLSGQAIGAISPLALIFKNSMISGFNLNDWMLYAGPEDFEIARASLQNMILQSEVESSIQSKVPFTKYADGLRMYLGNMSAGKVLFQFD